MSNNAKPAAGQKNRSASGTELAQIDKFREAARELETDDSEERFNQVVKEIAKSPPEKADKKADQ